MPKAKVHDALLIGVGQANNSLVGALAEALNTLFASLKKQ